MKPNMIPLTESPKAMIIKQLSCESEAALIRPLKIKNINV